MDGSHETKLLQISNDVKLIKELLTGDGEPHKGLLVRVDRLEQTAGRHKHVSNAAIASSLAALIGFIVRWLMGH